MTGIFGILCQVAQQMHITFAVPYAKLIHRYLMIVYQRSGKHRQYRHLPKIVQILSRHTSVQHGVCCAQVADEGLMSIDTDVCVVGIEHILIQQTVVNDFQFVGKRLWQLRASFTLPAEGLMTIVKFS